jgi:predicted aspartyl protease
MGRFRIAVITLLLSGACLAQSNMPFKLVGEHLIVVQGSLGDLQKRNLVIDTGAYPSIIDTGVARKLHIAGHSQELDAVNHKLSRPVVVVSSVDVGPIHAPGVRAMTADLSAASQAFGTHIDALIGLDVLQHASFRIDYRAKRVFFSEVETLPYSVPFRWNEGMLTISLQANSGTLRMLVDTGAQSTLLLAPQLAVSRRGHDREFANLGGNFILREVKLESVQLGDFDLGSQAVYVSDAPNLPSYPFDGFLSTIQFEQIAFDFPNHTFSWKLRESRKGQVHLAMHGGAPGIGLSGFAIAQERADVAFAGH